MEIHLEPGVDGLGIYGSISSVTPRGGVSDTVRRQVPGTYSTRGFHMDLDMIITHLDNFVDTWNGWNKVMGGVGGAITSSTNFFSIFDALNDFSSQELSSEITFGTSSNLSSAAK